MSNSPTNLIMSSRSKLILQQKRVPEESSLFSETKEYEGQRLTLNFQDIETRAVLQLLG